MPRYPSNLKMINDLLEALEYCSDRETKFITSINGSIKGGLELSEKQEATLKRVWDKVCAEEDADLFGSWDEDGYDYTGGSD